MGRYLLGCGLSLVLCLLGCGESTDGGDDGADNGGGGGSGGSGGSGGLTGGAVPLEQLPTRVAEVACKAAFECCTAAELAENPFAGSSEAECRTNYGALITLLVPIISSSVGGGRARYNGDIYGECLSRLEAAGCNPTEADSDCAGALVPLVPAGGACSQDYECVGTTCMGESGAAGQTDGVCTEPLANGQDCLDHEDCASGFCLFTCEPPLPNGDACYDDAECQSGYCDPDSYVCAPPSDSVCD